MTVELADMGSFSAQKFPVLRLEMFDGDYYFTPLPDSVVSALQTFLSCNCYKPPSRGMSSLDRVQEELRKGEVKFPTQRPHLVRGKVGS